VAYTEDRPLGAPRGAVLDTATAGAIDAPGLLSSLDPRHGEVGRVVAALTIVIGLILAARLVMRRAAGVLGGGARPAGVLEVLARYPIARGQHLLLLRMGQRIVLLHQGQQGIRSLAEVTDAGEVAALIARMEAGARADEARQFSRALEDFESEHARIAVDPSRGEIVDLTRGRRRPRPSLFGGGLR
jgi:flagellar biogenesis protein FliO